MHASSLQREKVLKVRKQVGGMKLERTEESSRKSWLCREVCLSVVNCDLPSISTSLEGKFINYQWAWSI